MFKNKIDIFDKGRLHIDEKIVGLSISQWLPCPLAIWNLLFGMAILLNIAAMETAAILIVQRHFDSQQLLADRCIAQPQEACHGDNLF